MKKTLLLILLLLSTTSYSQTDTTEILPVVVIGVRATTKMPITESTIYGTNLKRTYQGEEVSQILDKTPSITSSSDGGHSQGYTSFRLRGIDQTRVNMTLNGVPLNEPEDQGVYFSNYSGFTNNISSAQIQRGVGTSTNGVASYAGSINFESPTGVDKFSNIDVGYGSFNTMRLNVSNSTGLMTNKTALYTNFSSYHSDGYKYNSWGDGYSFFASGGYHGTKNTINFTGFTGRSLNGMAWNAVSENDIKIDPRTNYNTDKEDDDFTQSFIQGQFIHKINEKSLFSSTLFYNRLDGQWDLDLTPFGSGPDILNYQLHSNFYGSLNNYQYVSNKFNFNAGLQGNMYDRTHLMGIVPDVHNTLYKNTGFKSDVSGFIKSSYDINQISLFGDIQLRYTTFKYIGDVTMPNLDWLFINPKGGLIYNFTTNTKAYLSIGQSHREPTRNDMFMGNDNLITYRLVKPEEVVDYELGFKMNKTKFRGTVNAYYMSFKNEITLMGAIGSNGLPLMTNVDKSFRSGIELDASYKAYNGLFIGNNTNISYNRIYDNGEVFQPLYTPSLISNLFINYTFGKFYIGCSGKYHSKSFLDFENDFTTPDFVVFSGDVGYTYKSYTLMVKINNITNKKYFTNGYVVDSTRYFFVNAPRSVYLTLKIKL